jgi:hypothetical protein
MGGRDKPGHDEFWLLVQRKNGLTLARQRHGAFERHIAARVPVGEA